MELNNIFYDNDLSVTDYNLLRLSAGWGTVPEQQAQRGIDNSAFIITAKCNSETVGMTRVVSDYGYIAIIVDVIVLPEYQSKGIGREMMNRVMEYLNNSIVKGEKLMVNLMAAKGKETFYDKFGFKQRPDEQYGAGMVQYITK